MRTVSQAKKLLAKQSPKIGSNVVQRQELAEKAYRKMLKQGVIKTNPDWTNANCGKVKYILIDKNQTDLFNS